MPCWGWEHMPTFSEGLEGSHRRMQLRTCHSFTTFLTHLHFANRLGCIL